MKKLMSFLLIAGMLSGALAGCGGGSSEETGVSSNDTTSTEESSTNDTTSITQLKDAITSDLQAEVAAYQTAFFDFPVFESVVKITLLTRSNIGNGTESYENPIYSAPFTVCGNVTVDATNKTFTVNLDNCNVPPSPLPALMTDVSGTIEGSYETNGTALTVLNMRFSDNFTANVVNDGKFILMKGVTVNGTFGDENATLSLSADKISFNATKEDRLPCFNGTDITGNYTDLSVAVKADSLVNGTISDGTVLTVDGNYSVEWPPCITRPLPTDLHFSYTYGNNDSFSFNIAGGTVEASYDGSSDTAVVKLNGLIVFEGTPDEFWNSVVPEAQTCVWDIH